MTNDTDKVLSKKELENTKILNRNIAMKQRLFSQIQFLYDMSIKIDSNPNEIDMFLLRAADITSLRNDFEKTCMDIYSIKLDLDPDTVFYDQDLKSFDDLYFRVKLCASKYAHKMADASSTAPANASQTNQARPRLPKIDLFQFDGDIENFTTFHETFCSLVHNQTTISNIDKFHYLLSCTKGSALSIVKSIPITSSNYEVVWQSLLDKYKDNRTLLGIYLDKMLSFPILKSESPANLNNFIETFDHSYRAINALQIDNLPSYLFCHIALRALDANTRKTFEMSIDQKAIPTYEQLMNHIQKQVKVLEHSQSSNTTYSKINNIPNKNAASTNVNQNVNKRSSELNNRRAYVQSSQSTDNYSCLHCGQYHMIFRCPQFRELPPAQRLTRAEHLRLCLNCLKPNHVSANCQSKFKCFLCSMRHHTLIHVESNKKPVPQPALPCTSIDKASVGMHSNLSHLPNVNSNNFVVLLGTAVVNVTDAFGCEQPCRVLIDSGAQSNFMTTNCLERLGLSRQKCPFNIYGLAGNNVKTLGMTSCTIKPRHCANPNFNINAIVLAELTSNLPTVEIPEQVTHKYKNLLLADPLFHKKSPIDIILAGDIFPHIYDGNKIEFNPSLPTALSSIFGYVLCGKVEVPCTSDDSVATVASSLNLVSYTTDSDTRVDTQLRAFWEIEEPPCGNPISPLDKLAEDIYSEQHYRDHSGRYVSPLLLDPNRATLGESRNLAMRRFLNLERRLARTPNLHTAYVDFMREYEQLGHMKRHTSDEPSTYMIPHHCVIRTSSSTTPVRVVFDGSAGTSNGVSLNDTLLTGPKLHHDILKILFNFRLYEICFTADIAKMYRQILIRPTDCSYQHIYWREAPSEPVHTYELLTNTYGLRSAAFIAVRTLRQLAHDEYERYPRAAEVLVNGFYVDDLLWSTQSVSEASTLQEELVALLKLGGFDLRKWASNSQEFLSNVDNDRAVAVNFSDDSLCSPIKILGLQWSPIHDCFFFEYNMKDCTFTKRSVLKLLASIFDPVGFLSPCTFLAKCIMQDLWKLDLGWDEHLPPDIREKWCSFINSLSTLSDLRIERHMLTSHFDKLHIIAFCDASSRGYASNLYVRSVGENGEVKTRLLLSKSKVAPLRPISIPKLELMAAVLLSKLVLFVKHSIQNVNFEITALTDSSVALAWLQTAPYKLKTFVSNRVAQVIDVVPPNCWYHVRSEQNAADVCSRGAMPAQLVADFERWLHGPAWLTNDVHQWPISTFYITDKTNILELKSNVDTFSMPSQNVAKVGDLNETFETFSTFRRLQRVLAWCLRFANNTRQLKQARSFGPLTTRELNASHDAIIKCTQKANFSDELIKLQNHKYVPSLRKLSPFVDPRGFLRVGGRISQADLPFDTKHPLLLPKHCHVTTMLIEHLHKIYLHVGPRTLQGILCKRYWIVSARSKIRSVLSKCITCFKCNPTIVQPSMGTLPSERLKPNKIFNHVGCDLGGPFYIKDSLLRNAKNHKCYMALFVCFSTKCVHIEVLSDLSANCYLATLDRFVARRGLCSSLHSDCGTNFIAAAKHLKDVCKFYRENSDSITDGCALRQIEWKFNPPSAPNMGGLWESGIKSAKRLLQRIIGDRSLTFEELTTVFCKVEAILNSRPLCPLSDNPNEFEALTAGHFLIGRSLLAVPEYNCDDVAMNRLSRWQCLQKISQTFWKKWSDDFLHTLQQKARWFTSPPNLKHGDLVLIKSELSRPLQWPLGRVERLHPGPDNTVRVVTLRTQRGILKRPVNKLCPLPYSN